MEKERLPLEHPDSNTPQEQKKSPNSLFGIPFPAKLRGVLILLILLITAALTWYSGHNRTIESAFPVPTNSVSTNSIPAIPESGNIPLSADQ